MAWNKGKQRYRYEYSASKLNERLLAIDKDLNEEEAKYELYRFLRNNVGYTCELFLGIKLFPFQEMAIKGMMVGDYSMFVFSRGLSKCVREGEFTFTNSGMKRMKDVQVGEKIQSLHNTNYVSDTTVLERQPIWTVHTAAGYSSGGLDYHRTLIFNPKTIEYEWKFSKDINLNDIIPIKKGFDLWPESKEIRKKEFVCINDKFKFNPYKRSIEDWYYLFGLLIGDGFFIGGRGNKNGIGFCSDDACLAEWVQNFMDDVSLMPRRGVKKDSRGLYRVTRARKTMMLWIKELGFQVDKLAHEKSIPQSLLNNSKENICALMSGLFDSDGYVSVVSDGKKNSTSISIGFTSSSRDLIDQVQNLFLNLGAETSTSLTFKGGISKFKDNSSNCKKAWSCVLCNSSTVRVFDKFIGFRLNKKKEKLQQGISAQANGDKEYNKKIPCQKYIESKYGRYFKKGNQKVELSHGGSNISKPKLQKLYDMGVFDELDEKKIKEILSLDIYYDRVRKVEESDGVTIDLQVENEMCYYSNGFVSHNTFSTAIYVLLECLFNPNANIGVIAGTFRQCLVNESTLLTKRGFIPIESIQIGDQVQSINGINRITDKWENSRSKTLRIETRRGYSFEGKLGHKVYAYNPTTYSHEWKNIQDLTKDDYLPIQRGKNLWGTRSIAKDKAYLYGLFLGDGYITKNGKKEYGNRVSLTTGDKETLEFLKAYPFTIRKKTNSNCFSARSRAKEFPLDESLICRATATKKYIPQGFLEAGGESVGNFLQGLFDADGYCSKYECSLCSSSGELAKQVQELLLNFGIISKISKEKARGKMQINGIDCIGNESFKVRVTGKENLEKFAQYVGFRLSYKQRALALLISQSKNSCLDMIPNLGVFLREQYPHLLKSEVPARKKNISRALLKRLVKEYNLKHEILDNILECDFYYDAVSDIRENEAVTYDITVENEECYNAQGFIHHNSKQIFAKIEDIMAKPEAALARESGYKLSKGTDAWIMKIGNNKAIALPLANGERLRGFRFNRIVLDEFLTIPEKIFNEVILPFLGVVENPTEREEIYNIENSMIEAGLMKESERYVWPNNKLIILSSPSYKFEYMYKLYSKYKDLILGVYGNKEEEDDEDAADDAYRVIMQLSYDCAPQTLYDKNLLKQAKSTMSEMQFKREFGGQFVDESDGYFRLSKMAACTIPDGEYPATEIIGNPKDKYILAFDPNWAGNTSADHFAMHVIKILDEDQKGCVVHSYALAGVSLKDHMFYFYYLLTHFNIVGICGDYNGGKQFIDSCNESELFKQANINIGVLEIDIDKAEDYNKKIQEFKNNYNVSTRKYCILRKPSSNWIREANELLQANIDHRRILFAARAVDDNFDNQRNKKIPIDRLKWDMNTSNTRKESKMIDFVDHQKIIVELTKAECANIEVRSNPQGSQTFDLPRNLKQQTGPNRARKDSYSALVLGNWYLKIYFDSLQAKAAPKQISSFIPTIIKY